MDFNLGLSTGSILGASASILSGQIFIAGSPTYKDNPELENTQRKLYKFACYPTQVSTVYSTAVSTPIPDQNSTAVSNRGGIGASASAASTLSGQLSTAASSVSKENELENTQRK